MTQSNLDIVSATIADAKWNGEPCVARHVEVIVGTSPVETWWCASLKGTRRKAIEISQGGYSFFIDNEDGSGLMKVTLGRGSPSYGHKGYPKDTVLASLLQP